nr:TIR domain-containing protein [Alphaproteobacteria bacterium]
MPEIISLKYRGFLSYSHADAGWSTWLHKRLEAFKLGSDQIGRQTEIGPVPKTLRPIFRDRHEFTGGDTLGEATVAALDASAALIVVCSPAAANSRNVNEEVRLFRHRHPERPVVPVIVAGEPPGCFPPALGHEIGPDGEVTGTPVTIVGTDLRSGKDGRSLGLAKVVAGITRLRTDEVYNRVKRQARQRFAVNAVIGALLVSAIGAGGYFYFETVAKQQVIASKEAQESEALEIVNALLAANPAAAAVPGRKEGLVDALKAIQQSAAAGDKDYKEAFQSLKEGRGKDAVPLLIKAAEAKKARAQARRNKARSEDRDAAKAYREAAAIAAVAKPWEARRLYAEAVRLDPQHAESMVRYAVMLTETGQLAEAESLYRSVNGLPKDKRDDRWAYWARLGLGDIRVARGDLSAARADYRAAAVTAQREADANPGNAGWQRDLSVSHDRVGDVEKSQGNLSAALKSYQASLAIAERLSQSDPGNAGWQRDLSVSHNKVGDVEKSQGNLSAALKSYQASLAIRERLSQSDPGNAGWQRELSVSHNKVGDVEKSQGNLSAALKSYQASLAIR